MEMNEETTEDTLRAILDNLEAENAMRKTKESILYMNQPNKLAVSSINRSESETEFNPYFGNAFYNFTVNLKRPVLDIDTLELLSANIPQAQVNIPDDSLIFLYYRVKVQNAFVSNNDGWDWFSEEPSATNMYYNRLLPSYYKKELIPNFTNYGFNRTFSSYQDLATELSKISSTDLAYINGSDGYVPPYIVTPFIPNDISIVFNETLNRFQMIGNNTKTTWIPPAFVGNPQTTYQENDIVLYNGVNYISTNGDNITNPALIIDVWTTTQQYYKFNVADYGGGSAPAWSSSVVYNKNDIVSYSGANYTARGGNINQTPTSSLGVYWEASLWNPGIDYSGFYTIGWKVYYSGNWYTNKVSTTNYNNQPDISPNYWTPFTITGTYYTALLNSQNVNPTTDSGVYWLPSTYDPTVNYGGTRIGFNCYYGGLWYVSITSSANIGHQPNISPTYWRSNQIPNEWQVYTGSFGYAYLATGFQDPNAYLVLQQIQNASLAYDFNFVNYALPNLDSIAPQPITEGQTLNLRLGFTWNGVYTYNFQVYITTYGQGGTVPLLLNRFRPIPTYGLYTQNLLLTAPTNGNPYTATTYTADAFCNLVYSSIVNIYTSIIGPSTTDTQRNTNLLSTVPIDCNNLGITFYEPRISNKLTKTSNDIYSIYVEFRQENGSPYYFSNNAIITLTLGITYK